MNANCVKQNLNMEKLSLHDDFVAFFLKLRLIKKLAVHCLEIPS